MAVFAVSVLPPLPRSSRRISIIAATAKPRRGMLALSTSAPSLVLRAGTSRGSSSGRSDVDLYLGKAEGVADPPSAFCFCGHCGRRRLPPGGSSGTSLSALIGEPSSAAADDEGGSPVLPPEERDAKLRASSPGWYKELHAWVRDRGMRSYEYEAAVAGYKEKLFAQLKGQNRRILELGVGTGPNLKYYANTAGVDVFGVDPNDRFEKYARAEALVAGLPSMNFNFVQGVAEALPIRDNTMDAVVGTLVLCSVQDVDASLRGNPVDVGAEDRKRWDRGRVDMNVRETSLGNIFTCLPCEVASISKLFQGIKDSLEEPQERTFCT